MTDFTALFAAIIEVSIAEQKAGAFQKRSSFIHDDTFQTDRQMCMVDADMSDIVCAPFYSGFIFYAHLCFSRLNCFFVGVLIIYTSGIHGMGERFINHSDESVMVTVLYGRFRIYWNEVEIIVLNVPYIALLRNGKRIVFSLAFIGRNTDKMLEFFKQQIEAREIVVEEDVTSFPLTHQNARVWR